MDYLSRLFNRLKSIQWTHYIFTFFFALPFFYIYNYVVEFYYQSSVSLVELESYIDGSLAVYVLINTIPALLAFVIVFLAVKHLVKNSYKTLGYFSFFTWFISYGRNIFVDISDVITFYFYPVLNLGRYPDLLSRPIDVFWSYLLTLLNSVLVGILLIGAHKFAAKFIAKVDKKK